MFDIKAGFMTHYGDNVKLNLSYARNNYLLTCLHIQFFNRKNYTSSLTSVSLRRGIQTLLYHVTVINLKIKKFSFSQ